MEDWCERIGMIPLPLLDRRGGRDINKSREASTRSGRGGCSNVLFEFEQRTPSVPTVVALQYSLFGTATPTWTGADGVVVQMFCSSLNNAPRLCRRWLLCNILFLAQPPPPGQE